MKKLLLILPLVLLLCFTFGCQQAEEVAEEPAVDVEADVAAIESLINQVEKAFNEGDLDAYMAIIADNAVYLPPDGPALEGKDAIRNWYNFDTLNFDVQIFTDEIEVSGDWAFHRAHWKSTWIHEESGEKTETESKSINIFKRQADGSWKNSRAIWNWTNRETSEK